MKDAQDSDWLTMQMARALEGLLEELWTPPLHFAAVSTNGGMMFGRYDATPELGLSCAVLAQHGPDDALWRLPVNIMYTNERGEAARVVITSPTARPTIVH